MKINYNLYYILFFYNKYYMIINNWEKKAAKYKYLAAFR